MSRIYTGSKYRIAVLTDRLIRFEYSEEGRFTDEQTLLAKSREFDDCDVEELPAEEGGLKLRTAFLLLTYDGKPFSSTGLQVKNEKTGALWTRTNHYGNPQGNFGGTMRTLDETNGVVHLDDGIFSKEGWAEIDDSSSAIIDEKGELVGRPYPETDFYLFFYGHDYRGGLKVFFRLSGKAPMLPRYALGNWWSKYKKYTEESYNETMDEFEKRRIPLSVGVIDMDWHVTDIDKKYGTGWTGYTWNKEYFPDYRRFLKGLHERGLALTLNLHPADGIRGSESMYPEVANALGLDISREEPAVFDLSDPAFRKAYFDMVLGPYEKDGVDFWWIDWQQGTRMGSSNVDPLCLLNYYSFQASGKDGKRPMIFSRYSGPGSHRYPVGFSGDSHATWESLKIQPWFTSVASNIGYGWWSHDIGGHMHGDRDDERLTRWVQFGVFSPIMRLHSSSSPFFVKEPWKVEAPYGDIIARFMRLRHQMLPYLYTMNYRAWHDDLPLVQPMYYEYPDDEKAYLVRNEYLFGSSLLVGAITSKVDRTLRLSSVSALIPEGRWLDLFTGHWYDGGSCGTRRKLYRGIGEIPVLAKEGTILPLLYEEDAEDSRSSQKNPERILLFAVAGAGGTFTLYEDDNTTTAYEHGDCVKTTFRMEWDDVGHQATFTILPAEGNTALVPDNRTYKIRIAGARYIDGDIARPVEVTLPDIRTEEGMSITVCGIKKTENDWKAECLHLLARSWGTTDQKDFLLGLMEQAESPESFGRKLRSLDIDENLKDALEEML